jgi:hypothetical protein
MINAELTGITTLKKFYSEIRRQQEEAHGDDYCQQHDAIERYLKKGDVYLELGTHQGGTAARAMLNNPKKVVLVDISMEKYRKFLEPIAKKYCAKNSIELDVRECSSTEPVSAAKADVLLIDSMHQRRQMENELRIHGGNISKYIIAHDTSIINGRKNEELYNCLVDFSNKNSWKVLERGTTNVGYTVLEKVQ